MDIFISEPTPPPYDPENLFGMRFDYEPLKRMIEYLLMRDKEVAMFLQNLMNNKNFMNILNAPEELKKATPTPPNEPKETQEVPLLKPNEDKNQKENEKNVRSESDVTGKPEENKKEEDKNETDNKVEEKKIENTETVKEERPDSKEYKKESTENQETKKEEKKMPIEETAEVKNDEHDDNIEVKKEHKIVKENKEDDGFMDEKKGENKEEKKEEKKEEEKKEEKVKEKEEKKEEKKELDMQDSFKNGHEELPRRSTMQYKAGITPPQINFERELLCSNIIQEMQEKIARHEEKLKELEEMLMKAQERPPIEQVPVEEPHVDVETPEVVEKAKDNFIPVIPPEPEPVKKEPEVKTVIQPFDSSQLESKIAKNTKAIKILQNLVDDLSKNLEKLESRPEGKPIPQPVQINDSSLEAKVLSELSARIPLLEEKIQELDDMYKGIDLKRIEDEIKDLRSNVKKMYEFQDALSKKASIEQLNQESNKIYSLELQIRQQANDAKGINDEISRTKGKLDLSDTKLAYMAKIVSELQGKGSSQIDKFKEGMQKYALEHYGEASISDAEWNEIKTTVFQLNKTVPDMIEELEKLRELKKLYLKLQNVVEQKLDKKDFEAWKAENDFHEMMSEFAAQYIGRIECKREFEKLRRRIAYIENIGSQEEVKGGPTGDSAMIIKRGLGGWSCASCAKNLINLSAKKASFYPWAKLPNDPSLPGKMSYSRMLSLARPEDVCKSQRSGQTVAFAGKDNAAHEAGSDNDTGKAEEGSSYLPDICGNKCKNN